MTSAADLDLGSVRGRADWVTRRRRRAIPTSHP